WYHDHRLDQPAENVYKGLAGFHLVFNDFDTGDEHTGFRLPSFPQFDIPLLLADKLIDPGTGKICFDLFGFDGLVGDKLLVNGVLQPFLEVQKRRYRFRVLDGGPSRFYELFLTNPDNPSQSIPFWVIANDGNLLPKPVRMPTSAGRGVQTGVAERVDLIIDFKKLARDLGVRRLWLENRLEQVNGRAPTGKILPAGQRQIVRSNGQLTQPGSMDFSRKDVAVLGFNEQVELLMRFRDFRGDYPMHCHNVIHEDHAMMVLWAVQDDANDNNARP